jgi:hypothetical protein
MYYTPTLPPSTHTEFSNVEKTSSDFAISPFLMLPDSFGDIYAGELFSAYVAIVNGVSDTAFQDVSLSARLQTSNATHDLFDSQPVAGHVSGFQDFLPPHKAIDIVL